jgi:ribonuclease HI
VTDAQGFVFDRAKTLLQVWISGKMIQKNSVNSEQPASIAKWIKPVLGRYKCNTDAAFSESTNLVGIIMCIRDENRHFVLAKTCCFSPICEVHIGEALGLVSAMDWAHLLQLGTVDFEMDAKRVVDSFHSHHNEVTEFWNIIDNCKSLFRQFYENSHVEFVRRQANEVSHSLAKAALSLASSQIFVEIAHCIEHILFNEMQ